MAKEIFEQRGTSPRLYRNMLVFVAPDATNAEAWRPALRRVSGLVLHRRRSAKNSTWTPSSASRCRPAWRRTDETVNARLMETYSWLIVPEQPEATGPIQFQAYRISGADNVYGRAARKLRQSGLLITEWSPTMLNMELDRYLWRGQPHVKLQQVWDDLARYCYLPRLYDEAVLLDAVRAGIAAADAPFGYADGIDGSGSYQRLLYKTMKPFI